MDGGTVRHGWRRARGHAAMLGAGALMVGAAALPGTPAAAQDVPASSRFAVGSPAMLSAQELARATWGVDPCGGQIDIAWGTDEPTVNARSYWANPRSAYDDPQLNVQCRIVFNTGLPFSWEKFCTVLVHEYGHLAGRPHVADGPDVMSPIYRAPLNACATTPEPGAVPAAPPAAPNPVPSVLDAPTAPQRPARRAKGTRRAKTRGAQRRTVGEPLMRFEAADEVGHAH